VIFIPSALSSSARAAAFAPPANIGEAIPTPRPATSPRPLPRRSRKFLPFLEKPKCSGHLLSIQSFRSGVFTPSAAFRNPDCAAKKITETRAVQHAEEHQRRQNNLPRS